MGMNKLSTEQRAQIVAALVEGNSIRATCRMTGAAKGTVTRLLVEVGQACADYQDKALRNLPSKHIQCDVIWSFCYAKQKNVPADRRGQFGYGDIWTWVASIGGLAERLAHRVQITTDGQRVYANAIEGAFGADVDYAMLVKLYGSEPNGPARYSPAECIGAETVVVQGNPDPERISTSYVERQNLTMRMGMRRFTRLANGFSKKVENLECAVALHFMYCNFARTHKTLKTPPAMAAGLATRAWTLQEIVALADSN